MKRKEITQIFYLLYFSKNEFVKELKEANVKRENSFQGALIKELKDLYPSAYVFKVDAKQGYPDLLILNGSKWATLEAKRSSTADFQPNQELHVERQNQMSFSRVIFPENKEVILNELSVFMGRHE